MSCWNINFTDYIYRHVSSLNYKLDVVIFGASGFVGQYTVLEAVEILKEFRWGIAGRNQEKLEQTLKQIGTKARQDLSDVPIIIANVTDERSMEILADKCRVLINCCGPFGILGEAVVKACIEAGTHYVDVCNEPHFLELMQLKYHQIATLKNVYVICCCGFQSLPIDIGVHYMRENFEGTINTVEAYSEYWCTEENMVIMPIASTTTLLSIILACVQAKHIADLRAKFHYKDYPDLKPLAKYKSALHDSDVVGRTCVPFPIIAPQVVECSQYYFFEERSERPIQFLNYVAFPTSLLALAFFIWCFLIALMSQFRITRSLLRRYPRLFSLNFLSSDGPDRKRLEKTFFRITFCALGWSKRKSKIINMEYDEEPNKKMLATVTGVNPVFGVNCVSVLLSAITVLQETDSLPDIGGVYAPAAAFANTRLIGELEKHKHGLEFDILQ